MSSQQDKPEAQCDHLRGYWINKSSGQFRCYDCGHQNNVRDLASNKARSIEKWEAQ